MVGTSVRNQKILLLQVTDYQRSDRAAEFCHKSRPYALQLFCDLTWSVRRDRTKKDQNTMRNPISKTVIGIIFQAECTLPGVLNNLAALGYSEAQGEAFRARIDDAIAARDLNVDAKVALGESRSAYVSVMKTARNLALTARDALKPHLGREYSAFWIEAGFVNNLAVPRNAAELFSVVQGIGSYLASHPDHEVAITNVTAARFTALASEMIACRAALDAAEGNFVATAQERDAKAKLVRTELSLLLAKLHRMFDPFAAMWEAVGFKRPGFKSVPEVPTEVVAEPISPTSVVVKGKPSARAERYRLWKKVEGVDAEFVEVATRVGLDFFLEGLPPGATIQLAVSAVNSGGESQLSQTVSIVTP